MPPSGSPHRQGGAELRGCEHGRPFAGFQSVVNADVE